jgi:hypothetical protein
MIVPNISVLFISASAAEIDSAVLLEDSIRYGSWQRTDASLAQSPLRLVKRVGFSLWEASAIAQLARREHLDKVSLFWRSVISFTVSLRSPARIVFERSNLFRRSLPSALCRNLLLSSFRSVRLRLRPAKGGIFRFLSLLKRKEQPQFFPNPYPFNTEILIDEI